MHIPSWIWLAPHTPVSITQDSVQETPRRTCWQERRGGEWPEEKGDSPCLCRNPHFNEQAAWNGNQRKGTHNGNRNEREALTWISIFIANKKIGHDLTLSAAFRYYTYLRGFKTFFTQCNENNGTNKYTLALLTSQMLAHAPPAPRPHRHPRVQTQDRRLLLPFPGCIWFMLQY